MKINKPKSYLSNDPLTKDDLLAMFRMAQSAGVGMDLLQLKKNKTEDQMEQKEHQLFGWKFDIEGAPKCVSFGEWGSVNRGDIVVMSDLNNPETLTIATTESLHKAGYVQSYNFNGVPDPKNSEPIE
jgi:hypothetical protein